MSDLHGRYAHLDHQTLYSMVMAGKPDQVDSIAANWNKLRTDVTNLANLFGSDLRALFRTWSTASGGEYQDRVGSIVTFANTIAGEFGAVDTSLTLMSGPLRDAIANAESPAETDDHDNAIKDAVGGAAIGSAAGPGGTVVGFVVGLGFGHNQDEEEKQRAHQRMIDVVANLANDYSMSVQTQLPTDPAPPPGNMPHSSSSGMTPITSAGTSTSTHSVPSTGTAGPLGSANATTIPPRPAPVSAVLDPTLGPTTGLSGGTSVVDVTAAPGTGTGGPGTASGLPGGALVGGAAGISFGGLAAAASGFGRGGSGAGADGPGAGGTRGGAGTTGTASAGSSGRLGAGVTEGVLGREGDRAAAGLNNRGTGAGTTRGGAVAGTGRAGDDEPDERETWLTEDDMDWGDADAAPSVLGSPGPADPDPAAGSGLAPSPSDGDHADPADPVDSAWLPRAVVTVPQPRHPQPDEH